MLVRCSWPAAAPRKPGPLATRPVFFLLQRLRRTFKAQIKIKVEGPLVRVTLHHILLSSGGAVPPRSPPPFYSVAESHLAALLHLLPVGVDRASPLQGLGLRPMVAFGVPFAREGGKLLLFPASSVTMRPLLELSRSVGRGPGFFPFGPDRHSYICTLFSLQSLVVTYLYAMLWPRLVVGLLSFLTTASRGLRCLVRTEGCFTSLCSPPVAAQGGLPPSANYGQQQPKAFTNEIKHRVRPGLRLVSVSAKRSTFKAAVMGVGAPRALVLGSCCFLLEGFGLHGCRWPMAHTPHPPPKGPFP